MKKMDLNKIQPIVEIYPAVQGEGSRAGMPTIVVRTSGCTHRCHVKVPGRADPIVFNANGKGIKMWDVKVGDRILAWDELSSSIQETTINDIEINDISEYVVVKLKNGHQHFNVTPEHPVLTTRGWKMAANLLETDELVHCSGKMRNSRRMRKYNPMFNSDIAKKTHSHPNTRHFGDESGLLELTHERRLEKRGTLHPDGLLSETEIKDKYDRISDNMKANNPMFNPNTVQKAISTRNKNGYGLGWKMGQGMSGPEKRFWNIIKAAGLNDQIWFTGDGEFSLKCKGKIKVPDFKVHGENKFIEVGEEVSTFRPNWNDYDKELNEIYSKSSLPNTKYLAINMAAHDDETILKKVNTFLTNGIKIESIKRIKTKSLYKSYNFHCNEYNNYLVRVGRHQSIVSHNCWFGEKGGFCDSWYTSIHPEKGKFSIQNVYDEYKKYPYIKEMMLTGGSPTMHMKIVNELNNFCIANSIVMTIESEGSHKLELDRRIGLYSLSPKFSNTIPKLGIKTPKGKIVDEKMIKQHNKYRLNKEAILHNISGYQSKDYHYKPVWDGSEQALKEIEDFRVEFNIPKSKTYVMPAGDNRQSLLFTYPATIEMCIREGYNFTGRPHIIAYDNLRGV